MVSGLSLTGSRSAWDGMAPLDGDSLRGKLETPWAGFPTELSLCAEMNEMVSNGACLGCFPD